MPNLCIFGDCFLIKYTDNQLLMLLKGSLIIANANGTYVALSKGCTHAGTTVSYRSASNDMYCSSHGSQFNVDGSVKTGPAASGLKVYKTTLSTDGNRLQITA